MKHPLINEKYKHYESNGKIAIQELEYKLNMIEMIGFCKALIFQYDFKQNEKDKEKRDNYFQYLKLLNGLLTSGNRNQYVIDVFIENKIRLNYK